MRIPPPHPPLPEAVRAMLDPATYPAPRPGKVVMSQTHISWVFLAGDRVYKMKKPVALDFLDFSTLSRRLHYCHREVKLNRRLAPDVYLGVVPLRHGPAGWSIGGRRGRTREYLVVMRRLDKDRSLFNLIGEGKAAPRDIIAVGKTLALFHRGARRSPSIARYGLPERFRRSLLENFREAEPFVGCTIQQDQLDDLRERTFGQLRRQAPLMRQRVAEGRVVEGHGDLHARHVYLERGGITILDGIEFNFRFLNLDAACDLAFLTMDLKSLARPDLATLLLNAYLDYSGDYGLPAVLPLYESYRAFVRGKVNSLMAEGASSGGRKAAIAEARRYFLLADRCLRGEENPTVVLMAGVSGSGKSTVARHLAPLIGAVHLRSDVLRKTRSGISPEDVTPPGLIPRAYSAEMSDRVYDDLAAITYDLFRSGSSVVVDATFLTRERRRRFLESAKVPLGSTLLVALEPRETLSAARLAVVHRGETLSDADGRVLASQLARWETVAGHPGPAITLSPGERPERTAALIRKRLAGVGR